MNAQAYKFPLYPNPETVSLIFLIRGNLTMLNQLAQVKEIDQ